MVTLVWKAFLVLLIVSWFPQDAWTLKILNNPYKWGRSLSTRQQLFSRKEVHGRNFPWGGKVQYIVPRTQLHPILWSASNDDDENLNHPLTLNNRGMLWQKWKCYTRQLRNSMTTLSTYWIPPIPSQDSKPLRQWHHHFYPRFVARETLLGVRVMMRIYCLLILVGYMFESLLCPCLPSLAPASLDALSDQSSLHMMDVLVKHFLLQRLPSMSFIWRLTIVGPLLEEVAYRGIGFMVIYWEWWWSLFLWTWVVGFSPFLGSLWLGSNLVQFLVSLVPILVVGSKVLPPLELVKVAWIHWIPMALLLPLQFRLLRLASSHKSKNNVSKDSIDTHSTMETEDDLHPSNPRTETSQHPRQATLRRNDQMVQRVLRSRNKRISSNPTSTGESTSVPVLFWSHQIQSVLIFLTRWKTSSLFAAAHIPSRGTVPGGEDASSSSSSLFWLVPNSLATNMAMTTTTMTMMGSKDQYVYLRKFWGVFASSWLVESRLVSQRATLWGAWGAHMCFNTLTLYRLVMESLLQECGVPVPMILPLLLLPGQVVLDWMGRKLERVEHTLLLEEMIES